MIRDQMEGQIIKEKSQKEIEEDKQKERDRKKAAK